ncbi:hypothetical protein E3N88_42378 [Mikania micrantha]|uniref:Uncharacterized protein n=1 Tax=Mikania micrantha TaxID=192012 RepID=A0A5N6LI37_9ASTR|nr:hypothetical protein E3N88_42378 [Mikania micrantha]
MDLPAEQAALSTSCSKRYFAGSPNAPPATCTSIALRKSSFLDEEFNGFDKKDSNSRFSDGLQLKFDILLWKEDDNKSSFVNDGEEGILLNDFGESNDGRISELIKPLHILVFANVALALMAAPERQENELLFLTSFFPEGILYPLVVLHM